MADRIAVLNEGRRAAICAARRTSMSGRTNAFVAGFVGETNFIEGSLRREADRWRFAVDGCAEMVDLGGRRQLADGARRGWRSGRSSSGSAVDAAAPGVAGVVEDTIYGGGTVACVMRVTPGSAADRPVPQPSADRGAARHDGDGFSWPLDRARLFPA